MIQNQRFLFKFYVDNKKAQVLIDIEHRSDENVMPILKNRSLKNILENLSRLVEKTVLKMANQSRIW
jgi:hypothetical protein